jgi:hypothetical protein
MLRPLFTLRKIPVFISVENRVMRKRFWPKRDKVTGECRKLRNEKLCDLRSSPSIITIIKSRRMKRENEAGHALMTKSVVICTPPGILQ